MQEKSTLFARRVKLFWLGCLSLIFAGSLSLNAQQYINGNLSTGATHAGTGTTAPAGTTWSELQGANTGLGFGANVTASISLADNFVVPAGPSWAVTKVTFFAYSTGFVGATSPFVDARVQIFNTDPSVGNPAPIFGDLTTNRFLASSPANVFRTSGTTADQTRRVWQIEATVNAVLAPGTYWIEWALGNGGISNFTPPSTVAGQATPPGGNSKQRNYAGGLPGTWVNITDAGGGGAQDQYFIIDYATGPCSGTPAPGNTISTATSVCPGSSFTLTLQNSTSGSGVTYQWQSSPDGVAWTNITGATNSSYSTTHGATTQYRCQVTCSGNTGISTPVTVGLTPPSGCYCLPPASDCSDDDVITRVVFNTLNNASTCSAGPPAGYSNYTSTVAPTDIYAGASMPIRVEAPATWSESVGVWIDYNQNGQFEATEFTSLGNKPAGATFLTGNIAIPANATLGTTRMRVRIRFGATLFTDAQACVAATFSETEDYSVTVVPCVPVSITTAPVNRTITCGGNTTFTVAVTGSVPSYSWQYRTSASGVWQTVTNGGIYSGATTSTLTLTNVPDGNNGYQYRALVSGGCSAVDFSAAATLTVNRLVPVVSPASASICNGTIQPLTLTNSVSAPTTLTFNASTGLPLVVPDGSAAGILTTPVAVSGIPGGSVITNVSIRFSMTHTWVGDLVMNLKAPNGQVLNLIGLLDNGGGGNSTANFTNTTVDSLSTLAMSGAPAPRTGTFRADRFTVGAGALAAAPTTTNFWLPLLSTMNGDWQLAMSDLGAGDVGTLTAWSISITYVAPVFAQGTWTGPAGTMFTDAAATTAYTGTPATTIYVRPTATSTYNVTYSTATCTSSSASVPVTVSNPVTGLAVTPATRSVCNTSTTSFTATTTGGGPVSAYQWQVSTNGGATFANITGATSATLSLANVSTAMNNNQYRVIATAGPCGAVTSAAGTLVVNPLPVVTLATPDASITPGQTATITASSTNVAAASYSWSLNGSPLAGVTGSTFVANINQLGLYTVTATTAAGCTSAQPASIEITGEASDRLWIYPNPSSGQFQVRLFNTGDPSERRVVTVFNSSGARIIEKSFTLTNVNGPYLQMDFDLTGKAAGTYVVKVEDRFSGKVASGLVVISH